MIHILSQMENDFHLQTLHYNKQYDGIKMWKPEAGTRSLRCLNTHVSLSKTLNSK